MPAARDNMSRDLLTVDPDRASWLLRAFTLSATHPALVDQALPAADVVALFLHGVGREGEHC